MGCNCNEQAFDGAWVGTHLKYKVEITAEGFSMDENDFEIEVRRGKEKVIFDKAAMLIHDPAEDEVEVGSGSGSGSGSGEEAEPEMEYYILIDTEELGPGKYEVITRAFIPDDDVEGGVRTEVDKQTLIVVAAV